MDAINTETGEVIATDLTAAEIEKLQAAGAEVETEDAPEDTAPGADGDDTPDAVAESDDRERTADLSKVDYHGEDEHLPDDYETSEQDLSEDARSDLEWELDEDEAVDVTELDGFEAQYEQVQREQDRADTDLEQDRRTRQRRLDSGRVKPDDDAYTEVGGQAVRDHLNETGQAERIVEAFRQFKTDDRWVPDEDGERLNEDAVADLVAGDTSAQDRLYERKQKAEPGDRAVTVSMDMSGSMKGVVKEAKSALGALAIACREIGDDFTANAWTSTEKRGKENQRLMPITLPDEAFEWRHLDAVWPDYQDPITPGMRQAKAYCDEVSASERLMVVITDGQPQMMADGTYNAGQATTEAQEEVRKYRQDGYVVIGIGIQPGADESLMAKMFGEGGYVLTDEDDIAESLIRIYEAQMSVGGGR
jgi:nitric oxide reductase activation protein